MRVDPRIKVSSPLYFLASAKTIFLSLKVAKCELKVNVSETVKFELYVTDQSYLSINLVVFGM